jgi:uncharacterized protein (TIGR02266 family)
MSYSGAATAKAARENLGRSLASLQEDPNIPQDVLAVAQNLAQAVGRLFEAERAANELDGKNAVKGALGLIGQTLALLQDVRGQHRGVQQATETLATSMSALYPLTTVPSIRPQGMPVQAPNAPMVGAPSPVAAYPQAGQQTQAYAPPQTSGPLASGQQTQAYAPPQHAPLPPQGVGFQATHPSQPAYQPNAYPQQGHAPPQQGFAQPSPSGFQQSQQPQYSQPAAFQQPQFSQPAQPAQPAYQQPAAYQQPSAPQAAPAAFTQPRAAGQPQQGQPVPAGYRGNQNREKIEVNIGATTESNFFVGFSTEISEGGVFAATYNIQPRGTPMLVHITLPGGFDRIVQGVVKFVRDPMDMSADDTVPGMGIQFEGLDPEGRDLILRFIRKRPPMFYDE